MCVLLMPITVNSASSSIVSIMLNTSKGLTSREKCPYSEFSGPFFPSFGLNTEKYRVSFYLQFDCGKIKSRETPNTDTFHTV